MNSLFDGHLSTAPHGFKFTAKFGPLFNGGLDRRLLRVAMKSLGQRGHEFVLIGQDRFHSVGVNLGPRGIKQHGLGKCTGLGKAHIRKQLDVEPADVELVPLRRKLWRGGKGVVIIVKLFAADDDAPGGNVGARVWAFEVAIAQ